MQNGAGAGTLAGLFRGVRASYLSRSVSLGWDLSVTVVLAIVLLPVLTIAVLTVTLDESAWPHLARTVLPRALRDTLLLLTGTGLLSLVIGTGTAWLVTMYRFPGRSVVDRLLVLPLAMPTYIVAYAYAELLDYAGPVQTGLRHMFEWHTPRDYWFPDVRSLGGAVFVMASILYPYVYLTARASFVQQSACALEVARTLGRTPLGAMREVALPLARPALAAGVALVLMECLNDLGAVQYLGVQTLSASIYETWLIRSNLAGAAQISAVLLLFVVLLLVGERLARGQAAFHHTTGRYRALPFSDLQGRWAVAAIIACLLPVLLGFVLPFLVLAQNSARYLSDALDAGFLIAARNSILLAATAAAVAVATGLFLAYARRVAKSRLTLIAVTLAGLGYAMPGTLVAIGILFPLAGLDNHVDALMRSTFGISTGLILSGSLVAVTLAYVTRFLGVALGSLDAGLGRISSNLDAAARTLGETALSALMRVHLPILMPALGAAGLLVFVDCMKELPATLLLRPFNFDTLATHIYMQTALERFEQASLGALTIVLVGLLPVLLLHKAVAGGRPGERL